VNVVVLPENTRRALVFDVDGTLYHCPHYRETVRRAGIELLASTLCLSIVDAERLVSRARAEATHYSITSLLFASGVSSRLWKQQLLATCPPEMIAVKHPDISALLRRAHSKYKLGIISNNFAVIVRRTLIFLGIPLEIFDSIVCIDRYRRLKPDSRPFRRALLELRVSPECATMFGDTPEIDIVPAITIGMQGVLVQGPDEVCREIRQRL
jgi:HAD superfamily hydrolase (TIGR01549 family)